MLFTSCLHRPNWPKPPSSPHFFPCLCSTSSVLSRLLCCACVKRASALGCLPALDFSLPVTRSLSAPLSYRKSGPHWPRASPFSAERSASFSSGTLSTGPSVTLSQCSPLFILASPFSWAIDCKGEKWNCL